MTPTLLSRTIATMLAYARPSWGLFASGVTLGMSFGCSESVGPAASVEQDASGATPDSATPVTDGSLGSADSTGPRVTDGSLASADSTGPRVTDGSPGSADSAAPPASDAGGCPFGSGEMFLWAGTAPGSEGATVVEQIVDRTTDGGLPNRAITGISKPSIFPFLAAIPNGAAAIVIPGGGYTHVTIDLEGTDIAAWLNSIGVSAFVLKYRLPVDYPGSPWIPMADAERAIRTVRKNAASCGINPERIGVAGFSAGGHVASQIETRFGFAFAPPQDATDAVDARPSFGVLLYPVISMDPAIVYAPSELALLGANPTPALAAQYSSELQVTSTTSPTFLGVSSQDMTVNPQNTIRFDGALKDAGVAEELHVYVDGAHGVGIRLATGDMALWPQQCAAWLSRSSFIPDGG